MFHVRNLSSLDGLDVAEDERRRAAIRFAKKEFEVMAQKLVEAREEKQALDTERTTALATVAELKTSASTWQDERRALLLEITRLRTELETKEKILGRKAGEIARACQKHYELEQELAFYKIDFTFDAMNYEKEMAELVGDMGDEVGGVHPCTFSLTLRSCSHYALAHISQSPLCTRTPITTEPE